MSGNAQHQPGPGQPTDRQPRGFHLQVLGVTGLPIEAARQLHRAAEDGAHAIAQDRRCDGTAHGTDNRRLPTDRINQHGLGVITALFGGVLVHGRGLDEQAGGIQRAAQNLGADPRIGQAECHGRAIGTAARIQTAGLVTAGQTILSLYRSRPTEADLAVADPGYGFMLTTAVALQAVTDGDLGAGVDPLGICLVADCDTRVALASVIPDHLIVIQLVHRAGAAQLIEFGQRALPVFVQVIQRINRAATGADLSGAAAQQ